MPAFETMDLYQRAVLWERRLGVNDDYGDVIVENGVEIACRWVHKYGEVLSPEGETIRYDAGVVVNRDVNDGSIMRLGTVSDLPVDLDNVTNLYQVIGRFVTPSIHNRFTRRTLMLMRFNDNIPTVGTGSI